MAVNLDPEYYYKLVYDTLIDAFDGGWRDDDNPFVKFSFSTDKLSEAESEIEKIKTLQGKIDEIEQEIYYAEKTVQFYDRNNFDILMFSKAASAIADVREMLSLYQVQIKIQMRDLEPPK